MLNLNKKFTIYEDQEAMSIEFKWYSPKAFFFLFFTVFWNAFLLVWYTIAMVGDAPLLFKLFPILHVAVGFYMIYYTLCQFLNKTNIEIDNELLTIRHSPIPWWRGNIDLPTDAINQLYVQEKKSQSKNGTNYSYALRAKLNDDTDKEMIALDGLQSVQVQELEEKMERFIGITDRPVKGEYNSKPATSSENARPRRQHRNFTDSSLAPLYFSEKGDFFEFKKKEAKVLSITQYDWNDGNADRLLQMAQEDQPELLIHFAQNLALLNSYQEETINLIAAEKLKFTIADAPKTISFAGEAFQLSQYKKGKLFISGGAQGLPAEQWMYSSVDQQTNIRIVNNNGILQYYKGGKLGLDDFEGQLDLNDFDNRGQRDIEYRDREYGEEDLV